MTEDIENITKVTDVHTQVLSTWESHGTERHRGSTSQGSGRTLTTDPKLCPEPWACTSFCTCKEQDILFSQQGGQFACPSGLGGPFHPGENRSVSSMMIP